MSCAHFSGPCAGLTGELLQNDVDKGRALDGEKAHSPFLIDIKKTPLETLGLFNIKNAKNQMEVPFQKWHA